MDSRTNESLWERHAGWWQREFSAGADPEYEDQILPLVARHIGHASRVLDVGCGEGQVARHLAAHGGDVVGLDPTPSQLAVARDRGGGPRYGRARADALPCRDGAFDAVLVCLALEHVDRFEAAIGEVARVLEPGGTFLLLLCHPLLQAPGSGWIDDRVTGDHYWRVGEYLRDDAVVDEVAPGVSLRFLHRPLSRYVNAMGHAGLLIEHMEEPAPPEQLVTDVWGFADAATIPRVALVRARRIATG
jgi:SAM-dependent methyltransferase